MHAISYKTHGLNINIDHILVIARVAYMSPLLADVIKLNGHIYDY